MSFTVVPPASPIRPLFRNTLAVCALASGLLASFATHAATVTLDNGDRISGEIQRLDDDTLTLRSALAGEVKIPWKHVITLNSDKDVRVRLNDGSNVRGKVALDEAGRVTIAEAESGNAREYARTQLAALNPPIVDPSYRFGGRLDVGGTLNRGNSRDEQININGELTARAPQDRYTVGIEVNEANSAGVTTTSNRRLQGQYDAFLNERDYLFGNAKLESDELAGLSLRSAVGAGFGREFYESELTRLSGQVGLSYINENYEVSPSESFPTLSLGMRYDRKLLDRRLVYFQTVDLDTSLKDARDSLLRARLGLRMPVANGITVSTQLNLDYKTRPEPGKKRSDTALIFSVGYGF